MVGPIQLNPAELLMEQVHESCLTHGVHSDCPPKFCPLFLLRVSILGQFIGQVTLALKGKVARGRERERWHRSKFYDQ